MAATNTEVKTKPLLTTAQVGKILNGLKVLYDYQAKIVHGRLEVEAIASQGRASYYAFSVGNHHADLRDALELLITEAPSFVGEHLRLRELLERVETFAINQSKKLAAAMDGSGPVVDENSTLQEELLKKTEENVRLTAEVEELKKRIASVEAIEKQFSDGQ